MIRKLLLFILAVTFFVSCENEQNYSQLLKKEEREINDWLKRNGMTVLPEFPEDSVFAENEMYHYPDGIYFRLISKGVGDTLRMGDRFTLRYRQYTLEEGALVESYWTTQDNPYPPELMYGNSTNSCDGWQQAFEAMKRSESHAQIIVPSKLGHNDIEVVPYIYEMKIKRVQK